MEKSTPAFKMKRANSGLLSLAIGTASIAAALVAAVFRSTSSTAAIGFLFIPFQAALFAPPFFVFGYCLPDLVNWIRARPAQLSVSMKLRAVLAATLGAVGIAYVAYGSILTVVVHEASTLNRAAIDHFLKSSPFRNNKFALGALAQNRNTSAETLDRIARLPEPELHERMGSLWPVMEGNGKGLAVMRLVVRNPNVSEKTIEYLARTSPVDYVLGDIAAHPKTATETLSRLEEKKNYLIDWGLARNPRTPPDVLRKLLDRKQGYSQQTTLRILINNPSTPSDLRVKAAASLSSNQAIEQ